VEIGEPQSKSAPEKKLSYPADLSTDVCGAPWAPQSYPNSDFYQEKLLILRET